MNIKRLIFAFALALLVAIVGGMVFAEDQTLPAQQPAPGMGVGKATARP